ncbi:MAG: hypothetical protein ACFFBP_10055 [Promethearchaeota archaeon]
MVKVKINCPSCAKFGMIEVEENIIKNSKRGVAAVNVTQDLICEHSFIAYIDRNFQLRDCFISDFTVELPEMETKIKVDMMEIPDLENIDVYLITINIAAQTMANLLRCGFNKKKVVYITNSEAVQKHLSNFYNFIFKETFTIDIDIINRENYGKNKKKYKDYVIFDHNRIIQDKDKIMKPKEMKIENVIIQKFLAEEYPSTSLIIIKNEIIKAFELSKEVIEFNNNLKENEEFTSKRILDHFINTIHIHVGRDYLDFLTNIVENYFNVKLSKSSHVSDFLGY